MGRPNTPLFQYLFLQFILLWSCSVTRLAVSVSRVEFLPGFQGPLPFHLETGYLGVGEAEQVQLFYYLVESESDPNNDPLILWLSGGPGCSSWVGCVFEVGPVQYKSEEYNGSLPRLRLNPTALTKVANIIFVDSPAGAGFSYAKTSLAYQTGDVEQVNLLHQFLRKWLISNPKFNSNPLYIAGDSYSGITIPILTLQISNGNEQGLTPYLNLQGYLIGNPVTDVPNLINFKIPYAHGMGLISDELYKSLEKSCGGEYAIINSSNIECLKNMDIYKECTWRISSDHILNPSCIEGSSKLQYIRTRTRPQVINDSCLWDFESMISSNWANDPFIRKALHVREGTSGTWTMCNYDSPYENNVPSSVGYHVNLSAKGIRSLIYNGDHDKAIPFLATQAWIRSLNYSIVDDWRPWFVQDQIAGYTRTYSNRMTFATVKGAGHIAQESKPKESNIMLQRWLGHQPL